MVRPGGLLALAGVSLLVAVAVAVALPDRGDSPGRTAVASYPVPAGDGAKDVTWVGDSLILQHYSLFPGDRGFVYSSRLWRLELNSGRVAELPTPYNGACAGGPYMFESPARFGDELLGYVQVCSNLDPEGKPTINLVYRLHFIDLETLEMSSPASDPNPLEVRLTNNRIDVKVDGIAFDAKDGLILITRSFSSDRTRVLNLRGEVVGQPDVGLDQLWSLSGGPGGRVAFAGRNGETGVPVVWGEANLYASNFHLTEGPIELVSGVESLVGTAWSSDARFVAFGGILHGTRGLYVVNAETGKVHLVSEGAFNPGPSAWSPSGHQIAVLDNSDLPEQMVRVFDVGSLLDP